jgi:hypothetical protein
MNKCACSHLFPEMITRGCGRKRKGKTPLLGRRGPGWCQRTGNVESTPGSSVKEIHLEEGNLYWDY